MGQSVIDGLLITRYRFFTKIKIMWNNMCIRNLKRKKKMKVSKIFALLFLTGCAGWQRDCNSSMASTFGSDWIVVQYGFDGKPINCWELKNTAITNEPQTDGIFWQEPSGHLVH